MTLRFDLTALGSDPRALNSDPTAPGSKLPVHAPGHAFRLFLASSPPMPIGRAHGIVADAVRRRTKLWELSAHLHCSVIGTCLSTGELRQILGKADLAVAGASDHDLHGQGVLLAGRHDKAAKLLQKALDKGHRLAINQFEKAKTADDVRTLWHEAVKRGDIPGAYWAALTHPATSAALVREVFGEVHMLSHLVGAANRADIRRLGELETENAGLREKLRRQQVQLRDGITARDDKIRELSSLLARRIADDERGGDSGDNLSEQATLIELVGDLERRLASEANRRAAVDRRLERLSAELRLEQEHSGALALSEGALREELEAVEAALAPAAPAPAAGDAPAFADRLSLLYVGGRPGQISHLRALGERFGADLLHHDGGIEDSSGLLAGLVSRADLVMFPVDCVSHDAASMVKRLCRQAAKPYMPLRGAGMSSFAAALGRAEVRKLRAIGRVSAPAPRGDAQG